jgi:hypothetical protein
VSNSLTELDHILSQLPPEAQAEFLRLLRRIKNVNENNENECGICLCVQDSMVKLNCMHMFCSGCITQQVKLTPSVSKCGFCRTSISKIVVLNEETMQHIKTELNL